MQPDNGSIPDRLQPPAPPAGAPVQPPPAPKKRFLSSPKARIVAAVAAFVVLFGGVAGAYFGIYAPNQPENRLKSAIAKTLEQETGSFKLGFGYNEDDLAMTFDGSGQYDNQRLASQLELNATINGVTIPTEMRYVDEDIYFKLGSLDSVKSLVKSFGPEATALVDGLADKLADRWMVIDQTLIESQGDNVCVADTPMSDDDMRAVLDLYDENRFADIRSTSSDTVNERAATKYELQIDGSRATGFINSLGEIDYFKQILECLDEDKLVEDDELEGKSMSLDLWVDDSSGLITKLATDLADQDGQDGSFSDFEVTFEYGPPVDITKPEGATPIMDVLGEIMPSFVDGVEGGLPVDLDLQPSSET